MPAADPTKPRVTTDPHPEKRTEGDVNPERVKPRADGERADEIGIETDHESQRPQDPPKT